MNSIQQIIHTIKQEIPAHVQLVAVSKYQPTSSIQMAYEAGQRIFGESHVQELQEKKAILPQDIEWHFIGHLQTNKVKYIAPYISLIHAVDTEKLLTEIHKQGVRCHRRIPCLLQLHIAQEETKYGFTESELFNFLDKKNLDSFTGVHIQGLMCMASNVDNEEQIAAEFAHAETIFHQVKERYFTQDADFHICSWGMSDDYPLAIAHGSTHIRVGSKIFGER